eukprot:jgi/Mesvir1/8730/Mv02656-RA.1
MATFYCPRRAINSTAPKLTMRTAAENYSSTAGKIGSPSAPCCPRRGSVFLAVTTVLYCYVTIFEALVLAGSGSATSAPADLSHLPTVQYLQTPAVNGDPEGPYVKLTRVTPVDQDPKLPGIVGKVLDDITASHRNLYAITAALLPPATDRGAGGKLAPDTAAVPTRATWRVERLCNYEGILEPESIVNLPRRLEDYPPIGCGGGADGLYRPDVGMNIEGTDVSLRSSSGSGTSRDSELQTGGSTRHSQPTPASTVPPGLDESFVGVQLSLARSTRDSLPLPGVTSDIDLLFVRPTKLPKGHIAGGAMLEVLCLKQQSVGGHHTTYIKLWATPMGSQREWSGSELASACVWSASGSSLGARFLNDMQRGVVTKSDVELVFSHHKRDLGWSDIFAPIRTVYHKGDTPVEGFNNELPNVGRESHTYLSHIINNYDKLAQNTVFLQDHRPGIGIGPGRDHQHFYSRSTVMDYLTSTTSTYFILSNMLTPDMAIHSNRLGSHWNIPLRRPLPQFTSPDWQLETDPNVLEIDTWLPGDDAGTFRDTMGRACSTQSGSLRYADCWLHISDLWRDLARFSPALPREPPWEEHADVRPPSARLIFFAQGGTMAVSRDAILRHPKAFYQRALEHVGNSVDPIAGYYLEMMWYYIFEPSADESTLMDQYSEQMFMAGISPDMSWDAVMEKLVASERMRNQRAGVPRDLFEEAVRLLRRQLAEQGRHGYGYGYGIDCTAASFASSVDVDVTCPTNFLIPAQFVLTLDKCTKSSTPFTAEEFVDALAERLGLQTCNIGVTVTVEQNVSARRHRRQPLQTLNQVLVALKLFPETRAQAQQVAAILRSQDFLAFLTNIFDIAGGAVIDAKLKFEVEILLLDSGTSDPHFVTVRGDKFEFNGVAGENFCILADEHIHVNAHFMRPVTSPIAAANGHGAGTLEAIPQPLVAIPATSAASDGASRTAVPRAVDARTWMDAVAVMYGRDRILVEAQSQRGSGFSSAVGTVHVNGELLDGSSAHARLPSGLSLTRKKTRVQVTAPGLATIAVEVVRAEFWEGGKGPGANFLNLQVKSFNGTQISFVWTGML